MMDYPAMEFTQQKKDILTGSLNLPSELLMMSTTTTGQFLENEKGRNEYLFTILFITSLLSYFFVLLTYYFNFFSFYFISAS